MRTKKAIKIRRFTCFLFTTFAALNLAMTTVYADEDAKSNSSSEALSENAFKNDELVNVPELAISDSADVNAVPISNISDSIGKDSTLGQIDISAMLAQRTTNLLPDNPRIVDMAICN